MSIERIETLDSLPPFGRLAIARKAAFEAEQRERLNETKRLEVISGKKNTPRWRRGGWHAAE